VKVRKRVRWRQRPKMPVKTFEGAWSIKPIFVENNLSHFIHFQLQNNALKLHLK
jgi:hypothetical protein